MCLCSGSQELSSPRGVRAGPKGFGWWYHFLGLGKRRWHDSYSLDWHDHWTTSGKLCCLSFYLWRKQTFILFWFSLELLTLFFGFVWFGKFLCCDSFWSAENSWRSLRLKSLQGSRVGGVFHYNFPRFSLSLPTILTVQWHLMSFQLADCPIHSLSNNIHCSLHLLYKFAPDS